MKATYKVAVDVYEMVEKVSKAFPTKFGHIKMADLSLVFKNSVKSSFKVKARVLNNMFNTLTGKKILIEFWEQGWETATESQKALLVYQALYHISWNDKKETYALRKYDITGYYELFKDWGLSYERADDALKTLV